VVEIKRFEDATPEDYAALGMKSGLEIHQQLATSKKLFCRCPVVRPYSEEYDAEILRHMRPTLSELGEYDGTALMEFKTKKEIIYQIRRETVCTYEMDDTPPFELNQDALDIALEITMLLGCNLVSEVHIARKQYLDGSIPTGFQRTTILGVDGWIPYKKRRIGIIQLGLEEDACREVSDVGHRRTYRTDRLGIPLIETVTYPEMKTPQEVAEVAQILRRLARATGKVHTRIGAARQDVNVSIEGGRRVEIKGVCRIPLIPLLVHNETYRQAALLDIKRELASRGITPATFKADAFNVGELVAGTRYYPLAMALKNNLQVRAVALRGYRGILSTKTQPETTFAKEISDRVRVIACLDRLPNIAHSDMEGETLSSSEWTKIKKLARMGDRDVIVVVWGNAEDVETGVKEIVIRAREAMDGVPNETRQALPDGTHGFERILPGADRMYPDTDLPPLAITEDRIQRIRSTMAERPWDREERYRAMGLPAEMAARLAISNERHLFDRAAKETGYPPILLASLFIDRVRNLQREGKLTAADDERIVATLKVALANGLDNGNLAVLIEKTCGPEALEPEAGIAALGLESPRTIEKQIAAFMKKINLPKIEKNKLNRHVMGLVMREFRGKLPGKTIAAIVERFLS
jgi:glutamyl-tRNA(Gln) amidotransferase subunit E